MSEKFEREDRTNEQIIETIVMKFFRCKGGKNEQPYIQFNTTREDRNYPIRKIIPTYYEKRSYQTKFNNYFRDGREETNEICQRLDILHGTRYTTLFQGIWALAKLLEWHAV